MWLDFEFSKMKIDYNLWGKKITIELKIKKHGKRKSRNKIVKKWMVAVSNFSLTANRILNLLESRINKFNFFVTF